MKNLILLVVFIFIGKVSFASECPREFVLEDIVIHKNLDQRNQSFDFNNDLKVTVKNAHGAKITLQLDVSWAQKSDFKWERLSDHEQDLNFESRLSLPFTGDSLSYQVLVESVDKKTGDQFELHEEKIVEELNRTPFKINQNAIYGSGFSIYYDISKSCS